MARKPTRQRGEIEARASGSLRIRVYAGVDALTGRRHYLTEAVPAGPKAYAEAEKIRRRLVNQVDEQRNPRTKATVNRLMDRYLELLDVEETTHERYEQAIRIHIRPLLGHLPVAKFDGETLDAHQAILRRCRAHCDGRPHVEHAADGPHHCSLACKPHVCRPLATSSSIRKVHFCLSGALARAVRWRWITVNPLDQAEPPRGSRSDPDPPTAEQAAAILNAAFPDVIWGCLLWLAMTTGARRGELCAMRWDRLDLDRAVVTIRSSIAQKNTHTWEKDTKTHQQRRIALDDNTVSLLRAYRQQCEQDAAAVGLTLAPDGRLFSAAVDHSTWLRPSSVSNRYARMSARLGWDMNLHQLRNRRSGAYGRALTSSRWRARHGAMPTGMGRHPGRAATSARCSAWSPTGTCAPRGARAVVSDRPRRALLLLAFESKRHVPADSAGAQMTCPRG